MMQPTDNEITDARMAQEDVQLVRGDRTLTDAGYLYVLEQRLERYEQHLVPLFRMLESQEADAIELGNNLGSSRADLAYAIQQAGVKL